MKKIFLIIFVMVFYIVGNVGAAGTCVESDWSKITDYKNRASRRIGEVLLLKCTCHTDNSLSVVLSSAVMDRLSGRWVYDITSYPGTTAPTDDSDLEITKDDGSSLLGSNGTNFIDATTTKEIFLRNSFLGLNKYELVADDDVWTISLTNNAVASAIFYLKLKLLEP